ncbi:hypothetical protein Prubr_71070 [Polymorphospora rubra]|uniref:Uncharacterized protein n=1 Tax=Polymorphospora rubra TaxID=338584 RepID=A0A810N9K7_9ACTN|nr:hypothetical protein Prubr_71070 [Polymorphospora rubra]
MVSPAEYRAECGRSLNATDSPYRSSWRILPGSSPRKGSVLAPCASARMCSAGAQVSGRNGSACIRLKIASRPNRFMNQGIPAIGM